jgi:hypothetical protein
VAAKKRRSSSTALPLADVVWQKVEEAVSSKLPECFGGYEAEVCTGRFCGAALDTCKKGVIHEAVSGD